MRAFTLLLIGLIVGSFGAILQGQRIPVGQVWVPTGVVVALAVLVPIARAAAWWLRSRWGAAFLGVGWLVATLTLGTVSSRGDLVLDSGTRQVAYLVIGSVLLTACATFPLIDPAARAGGQAVARPDRGRLGADPDRAWAPAPQTPLAAPVMEPAAAPEAPS